MKKLARASVGLTSRNNGLRPTVRYVFPTLAILAALFGLGSLNTSQSSYVRLEVSPSAVMVGQPFEVRVYAGAHVPVNAIDLSIKIPNNIEIKGVDTGGSVITLWTTEPKVEGSSVLLRGGTFRKGFLGEHSIVTINAEAKTSGLATFTVERAIMLAGDGEGTEVAVEEGSNVTSLYIKNEDGTYDDQLPINVTEASVMVADLDGDGNVSLKDISSFMAAWVAPGSHVYDFDGDGKMTFRDFSIILAESFLH